MFGKTFISVFHATFGGSLGGNPAMGGAVLSFHAAWEDAAGVSQPLFVGTGPVTTDHDEAILNPDYEGVYREFDVDEPVWKGGRVVKNELPNSGDVTTAAAGGWTVGDEGEGVGKTINFGSATNSRIFHAASGPSGTPLIVSADFTPEDAGKIVRFGVFTGSWDYGSDITIPSSGRISRAVTIAGNLQYVGISKRFNTLDTYSVTLLNGIQAEDATGRSDTTTPSEYIATTTAPVQKVFAYANGNTVDANGVVTEARGMDLSDPNRVVTNDCLWSEDFTQQSGNIGDWKPDAGVTLTHIAPNIGEIEFDESVFGCFQEIAGFETLDSDIIFRVEMRTDDGPGQVDGRCSAISTILSLTSEWQVFTWNVRSAYTGQGFYVRNSERDFDNKKIQIRFPQVEDATGRSDTTTPSEYIATEDTTRSKYFNYANGNTVDANGAVTEATGIAYPLDAPYLVAQPEGTNGIIYSNELITGWTEYGTGSITQDAEGINGQQNEAVTLVDSDVSAFHYAVSSGVSAVGATTTTLRVYVKKQASFATTLQISTTVGGGVYRLQLNPVTGEAYERDAANGIYEVVDDGLWWIVLCHSAYGSSSFNTSIYTAINSSGADGTTDVTAQGFCVIGNVEAYLDKTIEEVKSIGPIFTTTAAVTTSAFVNSYPADNHSNTEGPYYLEFENTGDDVALLSAGTDEFLKIEDFELWEDDPDTIDTGWTDNGDGSYTCDGTNAVFITAVNAAMKPNTDYIVTLNVPSYTSGTAYLYAGDSLWSEFGGIGRTGDFSGVVNSGANTVNTDEIRFRSAISFNGTIADISIQEIDNKYLKLTDGTSQLQAACPAGEWDGGDRGAEEVTNGTFSDGTTGWILGTSGATVVAGELNWPSLGIVVQNLGLSSFPAGTELEFMIDVTTNHNTAGSFRYYNPGTAAYEYILGTGSLSFTITSDGAYDSLALRVYSDPTAPIVIDNISLKEVLYQTHHAAGIAFAESRGEEEVTNGEFETGIAGWVDSTQATCTWTWGSVDQTGDLSCDGSGFARADQQVSSSAAAGEVYEIKLKMKSSTTGGSWSVKVGDSQGGGTIAGLNIRRDQVAAGEWFDGTYNVTGRSGPDIWIRLENGATSVLDSYKIVSVKEVTNKMNLNLDGVWVDRLGAEEVTNGGFDTDTDWTKGAGWTISGGSLNFGTYTANSSATQTAVADIGKTYLVEFDYANVVGANNYLRFEAGQRSIPNGTGRFSMKLVCGQVDISFFANGANANGSSFDNVSVKEVIGNGPEGTDYDGELGSGVLTLGDTERNVKRWNESDLDDQEGLIDREMS